MKIPGFVHGHSESQSPALSVQACINLMPVPDESGGGANIAMFLATPGHRAFITGLQGPVRASFEENGRGFVVAGTGVYEVTWDGVSETGTATLLGSVTADTRQATISSNGTQLFITSAGLGYILTLATNVFVPITDADFPTNVAMGAYLDTYFLTFSRSNTAFAISATGDGLAWDALDIGVRSTTVDALVALLVSKEIVWGMGSKALEFRYDSDADFPFTPVDDSTVRGVGCGAEFSAVVHHDAPIWFSTSRKVFRGTGVGTAPAKLSKTEQEQAWARYTHVSDAYAWMAEFDGRELYVLTFPSEGFGITWVYDLTTELWFQWRRYDTQFGRYEAALGRTGMAFMGLQLVGSRIDGTLYVLLPSVQADDAATRRWLLRTRTILAEDIGLLLNRVALRVQTGVGLTNKAAQGADPQIMCRVSADGGRTWGPEFTASLGKLGDYDTIVDWWKFGYSQHGFVIEFSGSDPVVTALIDGFATVEKTA